MKTWKLYWTPEGKCIGTVVAKTAREAIRKAEHPYRKYLGEIYAEEFKPSFPEKNRDRMVLDRSST